MNKRLRTIIKYVFFLGLGILFAWLSLKNLDKENIEQINSALKNARKWLIFPVFFLLLFGHYVRALRWKLLIKPLGYTAGTMNSFFAVLIGYLVNTGVPRLGEIMKCTILGRTEKIPVDKLIGTIILERMIDALTLLLVFGITLIIQPDLYSHILDTFFSTDGTKESAKYPLWAVALIVVAAIAIIIGGWMFWKKKTISDLVHQVKKIMQSVIQGVATIRHLKQRKLFVFYTILLWLIYLMGGYIGFKALQETQHYGVKEAFTILSAGSIGMIASPGGIGAYAFLIQKTMQMYGLSYTIALAFGWILWLAQTGVIVIGGLISFVALPYLNRQNKIEKS